MAKKDDSFDVGEILINYDGQPGPEDEDFEEPGKVEFELDEQGGDDDRIGDPDPNDPDNDPDNGEDDELEKLRAKIAQQDEVIANLSRRPVETETKAKPTKEEEKVEWAAQEFISEDFDLEDLTPAELNKMLNNAAKIGADYAIRLAVKEATEKSVLSIPEVVKNSMRVQVDVQNAVKTFYDSNQDLLGFKNAVASVAQELAAENPDWDLTKLFSQAGKETRRRLGIKKGKLPETPGTPPPKPKSQRGRQRGKEQQLAGLDKEISDMLESGGM